MSKFLKIVIPAALVMSLLLGACAQPTPQVQEVIKTVEVDRDPDRRSGRHPGSEDRNADYYRHA